MVMGPFVVAGWAAVLLAVPAPAVAQAPVVNLLGSEALQRGMAVAARVWDNPCGGEVGARWEGAADQSWIASADYDFPSWPPDPALFTNCAIVFNRALATSVYLTEPDRICTVVVHEYGHLSGRMTDNPADPNYVDVAFIHPACQSPPVAPAPAPVAAPVAVEPTAVGRPVKQSTTRGTRKRVCRRWATRAAFRGWPCSRRARWRG